MKHFLLAVAIAVTTLLTFTAEVSAAVSINVGEPGFYGRLNIGGYPPPRVYYRQPRAIRYVPMNRPPIYLRVRPGHARQWARYCNQYNACNERVYFIRHDWYDREYAPRYRKFNLGKPPGGRSDYHDNDHRNWNGNRNVGRGHN
jgi:hypothetical protein